MWLQIAQKLVALLFYLLMLYFCSLRAFGKRLYVQLGESTMRKTERDTFRVQILPTFEGNERLRKYTHHPHLVIQVLNVPLVLLCPMGGHNGITGVAKNKELFSNGFIKQLLCKKLIIAPFKEQKFAICIFTSFGRRKLEIDHNFIKELQLQQFNVIGIDSNAQRRCEELCRKRHRSTNSISDFPVSKD